ncbi:MAG: M15 family metallopeptidase [Bacteroidales bacterium]|nr:M15 family metallopeptidase [Bacteroidales bacterium]
MGNFLAALMLCLSLLCPGEWKAGVVLDDKEVSQKGEDAFFAVEEISDAVFARMKGKSFPAGESLISRDELRYLRLIHRNADGKIQTGELVCNKAVADELLGIIRELYARGYRIEQMRLVDDFDADDEKSMTANNSSCFNYRLVSGSTRLSKHSRGLAIDINPLYNPCVRSTEPKIEPKAGAPYVDRSRDFKYKIDSSDVACKLFLSKGWNWGGNWKSLKDYQHFEKEIKQ